MELPEEQITAINIAATLHDIGKISVPTEILTKSGLLTDLEREIIKNTLQGCQRYSCKY